MCGFATQKTQQSCERKKGANTILKTYRNIAVHKKPKQ